MLNNVELITTSLACASIACMISSMFMITFNMMGFISVMYPSFYMAVFSVICLMILLITEVVSWFT